MREQGDPERGVAGLEHRDGLCGIVDQIVMAFLEPGGADDDRPLCRDARVEGRLERPRRREIDEDVGRRRELRAIAALVDAAAPPPPPPDRGGERAAPPAPAAPDPRA